MEFPSLGQHCSESTCKKLDFLPVKCDACQKIFCHSHMSYINHACPSARHKDVQVPVCPLCNNPVPSKRGEQPDIAVGAHIDNNCESDTARNRRKVFTNRCSAKGCKVKELIPVKCSDCQLNFCLKHRHPSDHQCGGPEDARRRKAAEAAMARQSSSGFFGPFKSKVETKPNVSRNTASCSVSAVQGSMSEDEALARALAVSMQDATQGDASLEGMTQEEADLAYARAIAESERDMQQPVQRSQTAGGSRDKCSLS